MSPPFAQVETSGSSLKHMSFSPNLQPAILIVFIWPGGKPRGRSKVLNPAAFSDFVGMKA
jgi:hypothetical protein